MTKTEAARVVRYQVKEPNFWGRDDNLYLVRCPKCNRENYMPAVATGTCAWCGLNAEAFQQKGEEA